jgi:hypothetical protein
MIPQEGGNGRLGGLRLGCKAGEEGHRGPASGKVLPQRQRKRKPEKAPEIRLEKGDGELGGLRLGYKTGGRDGPYPIR